MIASDQTGEAEFTLFWGMAEKIIGKHIHQVIANNQPSQAPITNMALAARQVRSPPLEVTRVLAGKYKFVVCISEGSLKKS